MISEDALALERVERDLTLTVPVPLFGQERGRRYPECSV